MDLQRLDRRRFLERTAGAALAVVPSAPAAFAFDRPRAARIMPLGDSITYGWPDLSYGGYRRLLWSLLTAKIRAVELVGSVRSGAIPDPWNEGHYGWTTPMIQTAIDSKGWLQASQPDLILLHIGTNDLREDASGAGSNLAALLADILGKAPLVRVIVAEIISARSGPDPAHELYWAAIPGVVAAAGPRVSMVDMHDLLSPGDFADRVHPAPSGYDKMARAWAPETLRVLRELGWGAPRRRPGF